MRIPGSQRTETIPGGANVAPISPAAAAAPYQALAGIGEAVSGLGEVLLKRQQKMQEKMDYLDAINAQGKLKDYTRTKKAEMVKLHGQDARGIYPLYQQDFEKTATDISSTLSEGAKARFEALAHSTRDTYLDSVSNYQAIQRQVYIKDSRDAYLNDSMTTISDNPLSFDIELQKANAVIDATTPGPEGVLEKDKFYKTARVAQLDVLLKKDNLVALGISEEYVDSIRDQIGKDLYLEYKDKFKTRRTALETQQRETINRANLDAERTLSDNVYSSIDKKDYANALDIIDHSSVNATKMHQLRTAVNTAMKEGINPYNNLDYEYINDLTKKAQSGEIKDPNTIIAIPNKMDRETANYIRAVAERALKPGEDFALELERKALANLEKRINETQDFFGVTLTEDSAKRSYQAWTELKFALDKEEDPLKRLDMLNPQNRNYVVDSIAAKYVADRSQMGREQILDFLRGKTDVITQSRPTEQPKKKERFKILKVE